MNKECFLFAHRNNFGHNKLWAGTQHQLTETCFVPLYMARSIWKFHMSFVPGEIITNYFLRKHSLYNNIHSQVFLCFGGFVCFQKTKLLKIPKSVGSACLCYLCPFICSWESQLKHVTDRLPGSLSLELFLFWDYYSEREM